MSTPPNTVPNFWQGQNIRLRAVEPGDAEAFYRWNLDSERARMIDFVWPPQSMAAMKTWAEEGSKRKMENDSNQWVIETNDGIPVGSIDTHHVNQRNGTFMYSIDVAQEHRCQGYASEAIRLVLRYYFDELRYQKCTVNVRSENRSSLRLHEKLAFQQEGVLRRMFYTQGHYEDEIYFGITAEEFRSMVPSQ